MALSKSRSYLGIASCAIFVLGLIAVTIVYLGGPIQRFKSPGLEMLIVVPLGVLMFAFGMMFGVMGIRSTKHNPLSFAGFALNVVPLTLFCAAIVLRGFGLL